MTYEEFKTKIGSSSEEELSALAKQYEALPYGDDLKNLGEAFRKCLRAKQREWELDQHCKSASVWAGRAFNLPLEQVHSDLMGLMGADAPERGNPRANPLANLGSDIRAGKYD